MTEPLVFEICFPSHITRAPTCRPGETIAGVVVLKLNSPMVASHLLLRFCGVERVRRTPVTARTEMTEKRQQLTMMSQKMVMDKEFFHRELLLWGEPRVGSTRIISCDRAHRFHFSFTMPYVNMPTPRQTPDIEISYSLEASLFTEAFDQQRGEKILKDVHKTAAKCFQFEPVVRPLATYELSAPLESVVSMKDAAPAPGEPRLLLPFQSASSKVYMNLHVFNSTPAYLPGETVELLILAPAGKRINSATFQLRENVRCRKSSAPIIDESDVPILWRYSVDLGAPQELVFNKLTKNSLTQDVGMVGRFLFTSNSSSASVQSDNNGPRRVGSLDANEGKGGSNSGRAGEEGLAITEYHKQEARQQQPLSPLAESQEIPANSSSDTLDAQGTTPLLNNTKLSISSPTAPQATGNLVRNRTGSLGNTLQQQHLYPQCFSPTQPAASPTTRMQRPQPDILGGCSVTSPFQQSITASSTISVASPLTASASNYTGASTNRLSRNMADNDDSISDRSSISDTLSIRYQPTKSSFSRTASTTYNALVPSKLGLSVTPVALGGLLAKGSYRFAKIQFTLPPMGDISPISSVFLDYEYTVDISMTLGGSFGTTKRAHGKLPLKIVTCRKAVAAAHTGQRANSSSSQALTDPDSLRDSLSCLDLSLVHSEEAAAHENGSPATTLTEFQFDRKSDVKLDESGNYPCLLSFIQNGERIPAPELEFINIGSNKM
ncbi:hypothetical protein GGI25_004705 [Coemansia spiralis]|uniref:Arrestin-like N-terminal domain-containing protein n=2 Tax=Coemansia TaxID=4863 RepID=A0A9W8G620_9FUNG|nr:hypothetical protein EDC05_004476 [Coemansia umbellata]KAJ2621382.1 hypothetical protein GGI26_004164 [Coemansia sp. RSA 1358]KAJ2673443.1 hypothetical protein GGI25_004705 [Coemansia spiralis]